MRGCATLFQVRRLMYSSHYTTCLCCERNIYKRMGIGFCSSMLELLTSHDVLSLQYVFMLRTFLKTFPPGIFRNSKNISDVSNAKTTCAVLHVVLSSLVGFQYKEVVSEFDVIN